MGNLFQWKINGKSLDWTILSWKWQVLIYMFFTYNFGIILDVQKSCTNDSKNTCRPSPNPDSSNVNILSHLLYHFFLSVSLSISVFTSFSKPFESKWQILFPFTLKYFNGHLLKAKTFSFGTNIEIKKFNNVIVLLANLQLLLKTPIFLIMSFIRKKIWDQKLYSLIMAPSIF